LRLRARHRFGKSAHFCGQCHTYRSQRCRAHPDDRTGVYYNAIFFTYALVLNRFYRVSADRTGMFVMAARSPWEIFSVPLMLGHLFDTLGRRR